MNGMAVFLGLSILTWFIGGASRRLSPGRWSRVNAGGLIPEDVRLSRKLVLFDSQIVKYDGLRALHERLEYLPLRRSVFRMWTTNIV